jgi:hypothetical protein
LAGGAEHRDPPGLVARLDGRDWGRGLGGTGVGGG